MSSLWPGGKRARGPQLKIPALHLSHTVGYTSCFHCPSLHPSAGASDRERGEQRDRERDKYRERERQSDLKKKKNRKRDRASDKETESDREKQRLQ